MIDKNFHELEIKITTKPDDSPEEIADGVMEVVKRFTNAIRATAKAAGIEPRPGALKLRLDSLIGDSPNEKVAMKILRERLKHETLFQEGGE